MKLPPGAELCDMEWACDGSRGGTVIIDSEEAVTSLVKIGFVSGGVKEFAAKGAIELGGDGTESL